MGDRLSSSDSRLNFSGSRPNRWLSRLFVWVAPLFSAGSCPQPQGSFDGGRHPDTVCTLKGPGRCTDLWLDAERRAVASAHQFEVHRQYQREHGLAGWVDDVDNQKGIVTVTLFGVVDPKLKSELLATNSMAAAVAGESLRTYDQISDRMRGEVIAVKDLTPGPGNSGVRVTFKPAFLIEGFRPKRIVRIFAGGWKVDDLPKEERLYQ